MNKFLKGLIYVGIFAIPFVPFLVPSSMFFPFITGKNMAFRLVVEIIFAAWAILLLRDAKYRSKWSWLSVAIGIFVLIVAIADLHGENPIKSLWSNFERMEGFVTIAHVWMYFMVLGAVMKTEGIWFSLFNTSISASVLLSLYGIAQIIEHSSDVGYRTDSTLGNSSYFAVYLLIHIFLCLILWWRLVERNGGLKNLFLVGATYVYSPIVLLLFYVFYRTGTRGALLGLLGGVFVSAVLVATFEKRDILLKRLAIGTVSIVILLSGIFLVSRNTEFVKENPLLSRLAKVTTIQGMSTEGRFMIWPMAWSGFKERPILGWGQDGFNYVFNKYYDPKMYSQEQWFDRTHNVVLDWLIAAGVLGFLSYLSIYAVALWLPWRRREVIFIPKNNKKKDVVGVEEKTYIQGFTLGERALLTGLFVAYFIHNIFVFDNLISYILFFTILAYIHTQEFTQPVNRIHLFVEKIKIDKETIDRLIVPIIIVILVITVYFVNWLPYKTNTSLINALVANGQGKTEEAFSSFKKALSYSELGKPEVREQLMNYVVNAARSNLSNEKKTEIIGFVFDEYKKQTAETPNDARYFIFAGSMLDGLGSFDNARPYLFKAMELSPKKQTIRFELVNNYLSSGQKDEALKLARETYELETNFKESVVFYAVALLNNKQISEAEKVLSKYKADVEDKCNNNCPASIFDDERIINGYFSAGEIDKTIKYYESKVANNSNDLQSRYRLYQLYASLNQKNKAITEIREIINLEPGFKTQGEEIIKQLQN